VRSVFSEEKKLSIAALSHTLPERLISDFAVDERGYQTANNGLFVQWQDGVKVVVWPEELATAKARFPTPPWSQR